MSDRSGYVYVASLSKAYYKAAVDSAVSLRAHYPEANITLFTHEVFLKESDRKIFSNVVTGIPVHPRAKMWGMARSPYRNTLYIDSDTEIRSVNIKNVFDILENNDIMFTKIIPHVAVSRTIDSENELEYHGGVILYNDRKLTTQLIEDWYDLYAEQKECRWNKSKFSMYNPRMQPWDQFTVWYLLNKVEKYQGIKHDFFPAGGHSYNYIHLLDDNILENKEYRKLEQIIYHYTIPRNIVNEGYMFFKSGSTADFN